MTSRMRWVIWLPVTATFAVVVTVTGFGLDAIFSSPGAVVFAVLMTLITFVLGVILGLVAILGARVADRVCRGIVPRRASRYWASLVHAVIVGALVAVAATVYLNLITTLFDRPSIVASVLAITLVAAVSGAISAWLPRNASPAQNGA